MEVKIEFSVHCIYLNFPKAYIGLVNRGLVENERIRYAYGFNKGCRNYLSGHSVINNQLMLNPGHPPVDLIRIKDLKKLYEI